MHSQCQMDSFRLKDTGKTGVLQGEVSCTGRAVCGEVELIACIYYD